MFFVHNVCCQSTSHQAQLAGTDGQTEIPNKFLITFSENCLLLPKNVSDKKCVVYKGKHPEIMKVKKPNARIKSCSIHIQTCTSYQ
mmetsp:Transcript_58669/g.174613  ORF Transcript_58669/g.174613 Transcript_58669/m.174613 type:complete len:86 (-) Transcript_58669:104-361(-)